MVIESIDSRILKNMFITGAKYLESKKKYVDELNVFPVPDGDTGTNMTLTILAAVKELQNVPDDDMVKVSKAISSGSLRGARGNSGVILSQLFRGFAKEISEATSIDTMIMANAFQKGAETAYKAVMKPKEGTILTVAKAVAEKAMQLSVESDDLVYVFGESIRYGEEILAQTPEMLAVLKEAGVVDAGGQGLIYILQGAYKILVNDEIDFDLEQVEAEGADVEVKLAQSSADIKFGYCTEFIIQSPKPMQSEQDALRLRGYLETIGDSIVAVADEEIIKIHVHTNDPGLALQKALGVGSLINIKIDNMREQHSNRIFDQTPNENTQEKSAVSTPRKETGFVVISIGDGLSEIFKSLGADYIVEGGQTMNPSTEDVLMAIEKVNADHVFVMPNNKNIILAAQQAKELIEDKHVHVIPTKSIPQGITALINYAQDADPAANVDQMTESLATVSTGQITYAVRDTSVNDKIIKQGDILGIGNDQIIAVEKTVEDCAKSLIDQLVKEDSDIVTIYYGAETSEEEAQKLAEYVSEINPDCDVDVQFGGQPLYYYILSVE